MLRSEREEGIKVQSSKTLQELLDEYKEKMRQAIDNTNEESGHIACDEILCELLCELGFDEIVEIYETQDKWYS
jgi:hypothetical protein